MSDVYTYNPNQVKIAAGAHMVTGVAEDTFVNIEPNGDGTTVKVGCYGDVNRAISVNNCYNVKITLLQNSPTNVYFEQRYELDQANGGGKFPFIVKDLMGKTQFTSNSAWVNKIAPMGRGKESTNREWELTAANGEFN